MMPFFMISLISLVRINTFFLDTKKVAAIRKSDISSVDEELFTDDEADEVEVKATVPKPRVVKF